MKSSSLAQTFFETLNLVFPTSGASNSKGVTPCEYTPLNTRKNNTFHPTILFMHAIWRAFSRARRKKYSRSYLFYWRLIIVRHIFAPRFWNAGVVKLVDTLDLGSSAARCVGSSPSTRTIPTLLDKIHNR